ncbi:hypothetical protein LSCM4_03416 [Leishmania orientalis]|uniref:Uncharacterized protein n=1 Tax=Leishmania orientalis TaxID=2249476 RepID=A0A836GQ32_9TRYP|nr:hypothetical protein LSCM4_03416 [Leishmania orientalis]
MRDSSGGLSVPQRGGHVAVTAELEVDEDCGSSSTGNAEATNPNTVFSSTPGESPERAAPVKLTQATSMGATVITPPSRPRSPVSGTEFNTTHSPKSEHVARSAGVSVNRERPSASRDYAVASATEGSVEVLHGQVRSAPRIPPTREFVEDM